MLIRIKYFNRTGKQKLSRSNNKEMNKRKKEREKKKKIAPTEWHILNNVMYKLNDFSWHALIIIQNNNIWALAWEEQVVFYVCVNKQSAILMEMSERSKMMIRCMVEENGINYSGTNR